MDLMRKTAVSYNILSMFIAICIYIYIYIHIAKLFGVVQFLFFWQQATFVRNVLIKRYTWFID